MGGTVPPPPIKLSPDSARRFHRRALRIDKPLDTVGEALDWLGYVQIDPINVCGRMHDLILRNRVNNYREGDLMRHMHRPGHPGIEHYLPGSDILVAMPSSAWPHLIGGMRKRRSADGTHSGRMTSEQARLAKRILRQIDLEGPLSSDTIEHEGTVTGAWGVPGRAAKAVLEKLFSHGRVVICERRNFRRIYDLPERVIPPEVLNAPKPKEDEHQRWVVLTRLKQRRLTLLRPKELEWVRDLVQPFEVENCSTLYGLRSDLERLDQVEADGEPRLLAPLDPLIYDRRLTAKLWDFPYTWEVYTPEHKRVRGYYALPLLAGTSLVGHLDLKADRKCGKLNVIGRRVRRGYRSANARTELAKFLGLK
jgi:uncharacterized protein YcaQ